MNVHNSNSTNTKCAPQQKQSSTQHALSEAMC